MDPLFIGQFVGATEATNRKPHRVILYFETCDRPKIRLVWKFNSFQGDSHKKCSDFATLSTDKLSRAELDT